MIVRFNEGRLLMTDASEHQAGRITAARYVMLLPGVNVIPDGDWERMAPQLTAKIDAGKIEVLGAKDLASLPDAEAAKLVGECFDGVLLRRLATELKGEAQKVARARLAEINEGREPEARTEDPDASYFGPDSEAS